MTTPFRASGAHHASAIRSLSAFALLASTFLCASAADAAGATSHVVAGRLATRSIKNPDLARLLRTWEGAYLNGTLFPDEVLTVLQADKKTEPDSDNASHGRKQKLCDAPKGFTAHFWANYWKSCPKGPEGDEECGRQFAFFLGALTHMITDGPWHGQFIGSTTERSCLPCTGDLHSARDNGGKAFSWCHPGGKDVAREDKHEVRESMERHLVADFDFDLCLASALGGAGQDQLLARNPAVFTAARFHKKVGCPDGSFLDPRHGGECWSCPHGTRRTAHAVDSAKACTTNLGGVELAKAKRKGKAVVWKCPRGQFPNAGGTECYDCADGWKHNPAIPVDVRGVCFKTGSERLSSAKQVQKVGCESGQFPDPRNGGECWSCPDGLARNVTAVTSEDACMAVGKLRCSLVKPPAQVSGAIPAFQMSPRLLLALSTAIKADGHEIGMDVVLRQMAQFNGLMGAEKLAVTRAAAASPAAAVCSGILASGVTGRGALNDSAAESAKFLDALWERRAQQGAISVIRTDHLEYAIVKDGQALHQSWSADCPADGDCGKGWHGVKRACVNGGCRVATQCSKKMEVEDGARL